VVNSDQSSRLAKTIAAVRIATGFLFLLFGEYKVAGPEFAYTSFPKSLQSYIQNDAVSFYRPFLAHVVQPHTVFFGYAVGVLELWIAISMIIGLWVRVTSIVAALFMLNLTLSTWWEPGHGAAFWRYFGSELDKIPLLFLFLIFFSSDAGQTWGLDSVFSKSSVFSRQSSARTR
jgi:uncharacterized membrane protein YphA (DoxX/SURF4 family)